jgi:hypothetical protein
MGSSQYIVPASCGPPPVEQKKYCVLRTDALSNPNNPKKRLKKQSPGPAPDSMASSAQYIQRPSAFEYERLEKQPTDSFPNQSIDCIEGPLGLAT